jgi:hypothetical protein
MVHHAGELRRMRACRQWHRRGGTNGMEHPIVERILIDLARNALVLEVSEPLPAPGEQAGVIDIGTQGRLLGLEVGGQYLAVTEPAAGAEHLARSAEMLATIGNGGRTVTISRRGPGWEVSFPSGNQCWQRRTADGGLQTLCAVVAEP